MYVCVHVCVCKSDVTYTSAVRMRCPVFFSYYFRGPVAYILYGADVSEVFFDSKVEFISYKLFR